VIGGFLWYSTSTLGALLYLGTWAPLMGNVGILSVMALVSVAIIKYFATTAKDGQKIWATAIAPALAAVMMVIAVYLLVDNRTTLAGGLNVPFVHWLWIPPLVVFVGRNDGIGRYLHEDA
jgi:hypothetical protein